MMKRPATLLPVVLLAGCMQVSGATPSEAKTFADNSVDTGSPHKLASLDTAATQPRPLQPEQQDLEIGEEGIIFTLERILFSVNSHALDKKAGDTLLKVAAFLRDHPEVNVIVEGHADEDGPDDFNSQLSRERAEAVYKRLLELGIPPSMMTVVAHGERYPTDIIRTDSGQSRRVEIVISKNKVVDSRK